MPDAGLRPLAVSPATIAVAIRNGSSPSTPVIGAPIEYRLFTTRRSDKRVRTGRLCVDDALRAGRKAPPERVPPGQGPGGHREAAGRGPAGETGWPAPEPEPRAMEPGSLAAGVTPMAARCRSPHTLRSSGFRRTGPRRRSQSRSCRPSTRVRSTSRRGRPGRNVSTHSCRPHARSFGTKAHECGCARRALASRRHDAG